MQYCSCCLIHSLILANMTNMNEKKCDFDNFNLDLWNISDYKGETNNKNFN